MRRLMLLRHAKSDWPEGVADKDRPLAKRGRYQCGQMGRYMDDKGYVPSLAVVSPARRTRETWELVRSHLPGGIGKSCDPRLYEASAKAMLEVIRETDAAVRTLLLVGHNPGMQELALKLNGAGQPGLEKVEAKYPTAAIAVIDFEGEDWGEVSEGRGRLQRFVTPKSSGK